MSRVNGTDKPAKRAKTTAGAAEPKSAASAHLNVGTYLASRLEEIGISDYFVVPGDYNLVLLDQFLKLPSLNMISCCNELNAGYAADGYARAKGAAVVVVTFTVGGLSVINAIAGAYSDDLPVICISGGPNSNDYGTNRILHHTIGLPDKTQQFKMFKEVVAEAVYIKHEQDAPALIDKALRAAMSKKKPVYIEIACNLATNHCPTPVPMRFKLIPDSNPQALQDALNGAAKFWNNAVKPVLIGGSKIRMANAEKAFLSLADAAQSAVAIMPNGKGLFPETHPHFIGTYWGMVSSPCVCETVEACDIYLFAGPVFNDYTTTGYSTLIKKEKMIEVTPDRVRLPDGAEYGCVYMAEFLPNLAAIVKPNPNSFQAWSRIYTPSSTIPSAAPNTPLATKSLMKHVQELLSADTAVLAETGDSWFNGQKLKLPEGCGYEFQMQYGSIGWSVGALLGYALGLKSQGKRVIALIGDGSFQMTAQEISTIIRYDLDPIIFLLNNRGYTIEVEIHDGPYNNIQNWDYKKLVDVFSNGEGNAWSTLVNTEEELLEAITKAKEHKGMCFIECTLDRDDCSKELLEWGSRVASANSRPHRSAEDF